MLIIAGNKDPYCIPKPDGFKFDDDMPDDGMPIMVKVKPDEDKLKIVEIEGEPVGEPEAEKSEPRIPYVPDMDDDGE